MAAGVKFQQAVSGCGDIRCWESFQRCLDAGHHEAKDAMVIVSWPTVMIFHMLRHTENRGHYTTPQTDAKGLEAVPL